MLLTGSDRESFRARLRLCVKDAGSVYALAKRAGIPANTIRRYLKNSEPTRPFLIILAQAGGVNLEWLATGRDAQNGTKQAVTTSPSE